MKCADCGEPVKPNQLGAYREVSGWAKIRNKGGSNAIALREETGRMICGGCGERRKLNDRWGVHAEQGTLI